MTDLPVTKADRARLGRLRSALAERARDEGLLDVAVEQHDSPFGAMFLCATRAGIVRVGLPADDLDEALRELSARVSPRVLRAGSPELATARTELDRYFEGALTRFSSPLDRSLTTGFRAEVLRELESVPYGRTITYAELAARAGRPSATRAAGSAMATNPLPILVPCHRVLRTGGAIGGYRGGAAMKESLLALERGE